MGGRDERVSEVELSERLNNIMTPDVRLIDVYHGFLRRGCSNWASGGLESRHRQCGVRDKTDEILDVKLYNNNRRDLINA